MLLVGVPAAFDLTATFHIPDYIEMADEIKSKGVEVRGEGGGEQSVVLGIIDLQTDLLNVQKCTPT